jgi:hypothetical protein
VSIRGSVFWFCLSFNPWKSAKSAVKKPPQNIPTFINFHPCFAKFRHFSREITNFQKLQQKCAQNTQTLGKLRYFWGETSTKHGCFFNNSNDRFKQPFNSFSLVNWCFFSSNPRPRQPGCMTTAGHFSAMYYFLNLKITLRSRHLILVVVMYVFMRSLSICLPNVFSIRR